MTFEVKSDRRLIRAAGRSVRYVVATHVARPAESRAERFPVNVALVLDRSGSMGGQKIRLAREAVADALRMLKPPDRFAVVSYDNEVDVVVESTHATTEAVRNALRAVERIEARGSTDLAGGWLRGCEQIAAHLEAEAIGRCLLMTDGLANVGLTDPHELARHASELRERHVVTSTFGIGGDFNELLLQEMANAGGGHPYYIEVAANIRDALTGELGEALEVTERDVELVAHLPSGVSAEVVTLHRSRQVEAGQIAVALGDLVSLQESQVVIALTFPEGEEGVMSGVRFELRRRGTEPLRGDVSWTYRLHEDNDAQPRDVEVDRVVARVYAARVRHQATSLNERGQLEAARAALLACAKKIRSYAGQDPELLEIAAELEAHAQQYAHSMPVIALKSARYVTYHQSVGRMADGKAKRRGESPR